MPFSLHSGPEFEKNHFLSLTKPLKLEDRWTKTGLLQKIGIPSFSERTWRHGNTGPGPVFPYHHNWLGLSHGHLIHRHVYNTFPIQPALLLRVRLLYCPASNTHQAGCVGTLPLSLSLPSSSTFYSTQNFHYSIKILVLDQLSGSEHSKITFTAWERELTEPDSYFSSLDYILITTQVYVLHTRVT